MRKLLAVVVNSAMGVALTRTLRGRHGWGEAEVTCPPVAGPTQT